MFTYPTPEKPSPGIYASLRKFMGRGFARPISAVAFVAAFGTAHPAHAAINYQFTLGAPYKTSAGVYRSDGTLVRTLWRGVNYPAGTHSGSWNELDDGGVAVPQGTYTVKLLHHNVSHTWEGVIGNTSASQVGKNIHRAFLPIQSMAIAGKEALFAVGYNEGQTCFNRFNTDNPGARTGFLHADPFTAWKYVATDGTLAYWAHPSGSFSGGKTTMVIATRVSDNSMYTFPNGEYVCLNYNGGNCYPDQTWPSCISLLQSSIENDPLLRIAGVAVQRTGPYLFVSYDGRNEVRVLDKTTGALVTTASVSGARSMATVGTTGLWVISDTSAKCYSVGTNGSLSLQSTVLSGLVSPLNVATTADNATLLVADGGSSQQVKAYHATNGGSALWTVGLAGGYSGGPAVATNKFSFHADTALACQDDGSFWVGDPGNMRVLRFSATRSYLNQVMYLPHSYCSAVDLNNPTRVFSNFMEFSVDYSKPLGGNNGSWTYTKQWGHNLAAHFFTPLQNGLRVVATLSNGRTYGLVPNDSTRQQSVVELPSSGGLRFTGIEVNNDTFLYADGSLRTVSNSGGRTSFLKQSLLSFDVSGNPVWGSATTLASAPAPAGSPYFHGGNVTGPRVPVTTSGVVISFDQSKDLGMHLGGVRSGASDWLWQASPSTTASYTGPMPGDGTYDIGNGVHYAGNVQMVSDNNVIYGYNGEFWKNSQASQWMHFLDDGLFVGQFGTLGTQVPGDEAVAGFGGNSFSPHLVQAANGRLYLWHNDESNHAGVHRWQIDGLSTIRYLTGSGGLGSTVTLQSSGGTGSITREYWTGISGTTVANIPVGTTPSGTSTVTSLEGPTNWADNYGTRIRGYITAPATGSYTFWIASDDGSELWLSTNDQPGTKVRRAYVNGWTNSREWNRYTTQKSTVITLTAGVKYYIEVLQKEGGGGDNLAVGWIKPGQSGTVPSEVVPGSVLSPWSGSALVNGAIYEIEPQHALGKRLDVSGISSADGANIHVWDDVNGANQRWKTIDTGSGWWEFEPQHVLGKRLDIPGASSTDGTNVVQWIASSTIAQRFKLVDNGDSTYGVEPQCAAGKRLDVSGAGAANGTRVQLWSSSGSSNQKWKFYQQ